MEYADSLEMWYRTFRYNYRYTAIAAYKLALEQMKYRVSDA